MIFFEKNKVLGVEPNRVLNILETRANISQLPVAHAQNILPNT
jgi:hypothetical protein